MADDKRKWVAANLDENTHAALYNFATEIGDAPAKIIERCVMERLQQIIEEAQNPGLELRTFLAWRKAVRKEQVQSQLARIAWSVSTYSDDKAADELENLCQEHGVSFEELMEEQKAATNAPMVVQDNGSGVASAVAWLKKTFESADQYPVTQILDMGEQAGFSKTVLTSAKRKLGLASVRVSTHWIWARADYDPKALPAPSKNNDPF